MHPWCKGPRVVRVLLAFNCFRTEEAVVSEKGDKDAVEKAGLGDKL